MSVNNGFIRLSPASSAIDHGPSTMLKGPRGCLFNKRMDLASSAAASDRDVREVLRQRTLVLRQLDFGTAHL
jgi:hypothetical protein